MIHRLLRDRGQLTCSFFYLSHLKAWVFREGWRIFLTTNGHEWGGDEWGWEVFGGLDALGLRSSGNDNDDFPSATIKMTQVLCGGMDGFFVVRG
jgi:hypothetical protein